MRRILVDSGVLLSYYQEREPLHQAVVAFFDQTSAQPVSYTHLTLPTTPYV